MPLVAQEEPATCQRTVYAEVVALDQPFMWNRLGTAQPNGMMFALKTDVVPTSIGVDEFGNDIIDSKDMELLAGQVRLRSGKRPRPIVLRANIGDCLEIQFTNLLSPEAPNYLPAPDYANNAPLNSMGATTATRYASFYIQGLNVQEEAQNGGTWVGANPSGLAAPGETVTLRYYCQGEGGFQVYSWPGGYTASGATYQEQIVAGLFGSVNIQPPGAEYYRSQVSHADLEAATLNANKLGKHQILTPADDENGKRLLSDDGSELWHYDVLDPFTGDILKRRQIQLRSDMGLLTPLGQPLIDYHAVYPPGHPRAGCPVLSMTQPYMPNAKKRTDHDMVQLVHSDLTAIITGPNAGRFPYSTESPSFVENPATPDRRQPYREVVIHYHNGNDAVQPFFQLVDPVVNGSIAAPRDQFAINYGIAGITTEILANRLGVGPMGNADSVDLKYEEFFLSSWAIGDPAVLVDVPANAPNEVLGNADEAFEVDTINLANETGQALPTEPVPTNPVICGSSVYRNLNNDRATLAYYPDDPSNVYHSYLRDHLKFRITNPGPTVPHVHHQHAHQWLHSPNSDDGHYLDSQLITPGATFTLEMTYNGSGNRNQTVGDSIFHCHFYPHFAAGMWSLWRVHDVYETGTVLDEYGRPVPGPNRTLPDGEIVTGTPIPAIVPLPTLGMPPMPAPVVLTADGRRSITQPTGQTLEGDPVYTNPGYPFFIPGVAGHRGPHPPLDFAYAEDDDGNQILDDLGHPIPLDGGLPRHLILDGQIVREFHTRWDFTKDFVLLDEEELVDVSAECTADYSLKEVPKVLAGEMIAFQLPEDGTDVEKAAMDFHATRTHRTYLPNGNPGNYTTNGLPPVAGAPYAEPSVSDDGNSNFDVRRYKGVNVQMDVVFNKAGWHFPQQRFITLWDDVHATVTGQRPPEPLFFRSNTGDTIEYWHTNLVPNYYEMDDFQVRTPTDILGQHIHLVKFDVTSSDGAGNGWNYEDGTFSAEEVRERILAANAAGGLFGFDESTQFIDPNSQQFLCIQDYKSFYPFGDVIPDGQDWNGAQTTIQRWDTDPLLNDLGVDRTLRTVFTHDHFGPSTHQQAGLYAGLVVEPENSKWFTSGPIYAYNQSISPSQNDDMPPVPELPPGSPLHTRDDGGPTTWAAVIETANPDDTYREFLLEFQDLALSYTANSKSEVSLPMDTSTMPPSVFPLITICSLANTSGCTTGTGTVGIPQSLFDAIETNLNLCRIDLLLRRIFARNGITLSGFAQVMGSECPMDTEVVDPNVWIIQDPVQGAPDSMEQYTITLTGSGSTATFGITVDSMEPGWSDVNCAIAPAANGTPQPQVVAVVQGESSYLVNYRNEPIPMRVTDPAVNSLDTYQCQTLTEASLTTDEGAAATDMTQAYSSIPRYIEQLNTQPLADPINAADPTGFHWPLNPLNPRSLVTDNDPYTPLLAAYQGDKVQVRTLVGAHVAPHSFMIHGVKWFFEPSYTNSGYRPMQGMGISEHFEMLFDIPGSTNGNDPSGSGKADFADYLYQTDSSLGGIMNGTFGLMRAYSETKDDIYRLVNNPEDVASAKRDAMLTRYQAVKDTFDSGTLPANFKEFTVLAGTVGSFVEGGILLINDRGQSTGTPGEQPVSAPNDTILQNPYALIYMDADDQVTGGTPAQYVQPMVLRVNAGDWVKITLENQFDTTDDTFSTSNPSGTATATCPWNFGPLPGITLKTSTAAGLHPQLMSFDISESNGFNAGYSTGQTAEAGGTQTFYWYAGNLEASADGSVAETPVELGSIILMPADTNVQQTKGLYGALIVEPQGSTWVNDQYPNPPALANGSGVLENKTSASIIDASGAIAYREFVSLPAGRFATVPCRLRRRHGFRFPNGNQRL